MGNRPIDTHRIWERGAPAHSLGRIAVAVLTLIGLVGVTACDSNPTAPYGGPDDPRGLSRAELRDSMATRPPETFYFNVRGCGPSFVSPNTQCSLQGQWGNTLYGQFASRDITAEAEWVSSNPEAVGIGRPGELIARSSGDADVYAIFRAKRTDSIRFRVFGDGDRPRAIAPRTLGSVIVTGAPASPVADALIEVIEGRNVGARTNTDARGVFRFEPWVCGPATIKFTKLGYADIVVSRVTCEGNDWQIGSINMTPVP